MTDTSAVLRGYVDWQNQAYYQNLVLEAGFKYQDITAGGTEWKTARVTKIPTNGGEFSVKISGLTKGHAYRFYPWVTMTMQGPGYGHYNDQEHAHVFTAGGQNKINIEANLPMGYVGKSYKGTLTASGGDGNYIWNGSVQGSSYRAVKNNGLVLYPDGIISGAPQEATPENLPLQVWVTVTDTSGNVGTGTFTIPVEEPLLITNQSLPGCVVGTPYKATDGKTVTLTAAGGKGPYTWTGTITPANGLSIKADGSITGTPQKAGTSTVNARLTDSKGRIATANLSIQVFDRIGITTTSLPNGIAGLGYQTSDGQPVKLIATGGDGRYTWSGTISPANGLTLKADGSIIGTPQAPAVSTITATVKDGFGQKASATFTIKVVKQMQITTTMLPSGVTGEYYKPFDAEDITFSDIQKWLSYMDSSALDEKLVTLAATGGDGKYTWSGTITPANGTLGVTAEGRITGIPDKPTGATPLTIEVEVKDGSGNKAKASFKLFINDPLPPASVGKLYSVDLAGSGGDEKYTWSGTVTPANGTLTVTADGKITGTPA
ncbi:MAG: putative Ig domain-containing protein, partial [Bilifractor sp.]